MKYYKQCLAIAKASHKGQKRMLNGESYIQHPIRVAKRFGDDTMKCIAVLHDVLEDTKTTEQDLLKAGIPEKIIKAVETLTKKADDSYITFIIRICNSDVMAMKVKIADLEDNMKDLPEGNLKEKYRFAHYLLSDSYYSRIRRD